MHGRDLSDFFLFLHQRAANCISESLPGISALPVASAR
jgi:hypothetical protein